MSLEQPKYVAYSIFGNGIYIYYLNTKKLKVYIPLRGKLEYVNPTAIISFTDELITFINYGTYLCVYNWKTCTLLSSVSLERRQWCHWVQPNTRDGYYVTNTNAEKLICMNQTYDEIFEYPLSTNPLDLPSTTIELLRNTFDYNEDKTTYTTRHPGYFTYRQKDTRGYTYYVSLEYFVEIHYQESTHLVRY